MPGRVEGLALDARLAAGSGPELGAALLGVVHEAVEAPTLSASDDEVRRTGLAAVHELEARAAPPGQFSGELGVDRDFARPLALPSLGLEGLTVVLRGQVNAAQGLGLIVDVSPTQAADLPFAHAGEQRQRSEDACLGFWSDQPSDVLESVGLPRSATVLTTQESARQNARIDEHQLLTPRIAACGAEEAVDVRYVLLSERAARLRAHRFEQLAHELLDVPWSKLFTRQIRQPRATSQVGVDDPAVIHRVAVASLFSPREQELTERHGRPLSTRERSGAHLADPLSLERFGSTAIGASWLPYLFARRISKRDPVRGSCLGLPRDDGHLLDLLLIVKPGHHLVPKKATHRADPNARKPELDQLRNLVSLHAKQRCNLNESEHFLLLHRVHPLGRNLCEQSAVTHHPSQFGPVDRCTMVHDRSPKRRHASEARRRSSAFGAPPVTSP